MNKQPHPPLEWLSGGDMGQLVCEKDWSDSPLGPVESWPQSLRTVVGILLNSRYPMFVFWGREYIKIYNDSYRPILGEKHPWALGQPGERVWSEIWPTIGPMVEQVMQQGEATWSDDLLLFMQRYGYTEEVYFTFSYSPVHDASGQVAGVFCACTETTSKILGNRRLKTLHDLAAAPTKAHSLLDVARLSVDLLADNAADIPFALLYECAAQYENTAIEARLIASSGLNTNDAPDVAPDVLSEESAWPLSEVVSSQQPVLLENLQEHFGNVPAGPWPEGPVSALVMPVMPDQQVGVSHVLILGVSARRAFDEDYRSFFGLVSGQFASSFAQVQAAESARLRAEKLAALDHAKTVFFQNVSHEFRTPLTLMLGPVQDLLQTDLPEAERQSLILVWRAGQRLRKLVNSLLEFSRIEQSRAQMNLQPTDLCTFTKDLASTFRSLIERAGLRYTVECQPDITGVMVDRSMWEKIVLNLLSNAFKFTLNGDIHLRLSASDDTVTLEVQDTGIGISEQDAVQLFERFYRVENAGGRSEEGSGIGLAMVRELIKLHNGDIHVTSTPGKGSTFTVTLPRHTKPDAMPASEAQPPETHVTEAFMLEAESWLLNDVVPTTTQTPTLTPDQTTPRAHVLIADDNTDMRQYLTRLLTPYYQISNATNGQEALEFIRTQRPDLLLSDVMMPALDGLELLTVIRNDPELRTLPVILLSARAGEEARVEGLNAGADAYLIKPFAAQELIARVSATLELSALRQESLRIERAAREHVEQARQQLELRVQERTREVRALASQLTLTEQLERHRLARVLHDELQQQLYAVQFALHSLKPVVADEHQGKVSEAYTFLMEGIRMIRQIMTDLSPAVLEEDNFSSILRWIAVSKHQKHGLEVAVDAPEELKIEKKAMRALLFYLIRELLLNVVKHAGIKQATVRLHQNATSLNIMVIDEGQGFNVDDVSTKANASGLGLSGAQDRLKLFGGQLVLNSQPGHGTRVTITVPNGSLNYD